MNGSESGRGTAGRAYGREFRKCRGLLGGFLLGGLLLPKLAVVIRGKAGLASKRRQLDAALFQTLLEFGPVLA